MGSLEPCLSILPLTGHPPKVAFTGYFPSVPMRASLGPEVQFVIPTHTLLPQSLYLEVA